jgi:L-alanine-DL-glutamate epimerase-like enolase superfamily enzyme
VTGPRNNRLALSGLTFGGFAVAGTYYQGSASGFSQLPAHVIRARMWRQITDLKRIPLYLGRFLLYHPDFSLMKSVQSRRQFFKRSAAATAAASLAGFLPESSLEAIPDFVNTYSGPSELKITDMRTVTVRGRHIIRLDTNQGIYGYGEVRDGASKTYALMLKSRIVGMNPCNVDKIFRGIKQFGYHARQAGGVCAVEMACWDLAGKAWGVPCWQMLGGKFRDRVRVYSDTPFSKQPGEQGRRLKERVERGFTFLKMDLPISLLEGIEGTLTWPKGEIDPFSQWSGSDLSVNLEHPFTGIRITEKGLDVFEQYVAGVRGIIGWEIPLATDHYGHFGIEDGIKLAGRLDKYNLALLEDMVPWYFTDQYIRLKNSCTTPILTGEDIYLKEEFKKLFEAGAISICHPDLATAGGLLETKKIGDLAMEYGVSMAMHMAGNPVTLFASIHSAAATENFLVLEHHNVDDDWYDTLVDGVPKPIVQEDGHIPVPDTPGLGIELNEEAVKANISSGEYFAPTPEWDGENSHDRLWSFEKPGKSQDKESF